MQVFAIRHLRFAICRRPATARGQHLGHDFARGQIARQAGLSCRTEDAAHRAARLRADADRAALPGRGADVIVKHEDGLDGQPVVQPEKPLDRLPIAGALLVDAFQRIDAHLCGQALAQRLREVRHRRRIVRQLLVEPLPHLVGAEARLIPASQQVDELIVAQIEEGVALCRRHQRKDHTTAAMRLQTNRGPSFEPRVRASSFQLPASR